MATKETSLAKTEDFKAKAIEYLTAMGKMNSLTEQQKNIFIEIAVSCGLNPFKREIYPIGYGNNFNVITGYEVYQKRAERTGLFDGYETEWEEDANGNIKTCTCIVYRKDRSHPTKQKVYFAEYNLGNSIWKSKPHTMIEKVAIAQAFRKAFPDELGGMPYTAEELDKIKEGTVEVVETIIEQPKQQTKVEEQPKAIAPKLQELEEAKKKYIKFSKSGIFTKEEMSHFKECWGNSWEECIAEMEEAYSMKTQHEQEPQPEPEPQTEPEQKQGDDNDPF